MKRAAGSPAWRGLPQHGRVGAHRTDFVIIPEPLNVDRICIGHRGVYWFEVTTHGRIGHGSMPFLGVSAIEHMGVILDRDPARTDAGPRGADDGGAGGAGRRRGTRR